MTLTLTAMRGYSGSGKSTHAKRIAYQSGAYVSNRDSLRFMMFGEYWTGKPEHEEAVTVAQNASVKALLKSGRSVIVDDTNLNTSYMKAWAKLASECGAEFGIVDMRTDVETCLKQDQERWMANGRYVGHDVIHKQAKRFPMSKWRSAEDLRTTPIKVEPYVPGPEAVQDAVIFDIDGTIADMAGRRSPYDYSRVSGDHPHEDMIELAWNFKSFGYTIVVCSGRDDTCKQDTLEWLRKHQMPFDKLLMRPADAKDANGNKHPDFRVKLDLFNEYLRDSRYRVRYVFDDRDQVVQLWRELGIRTMQVAPGDF